MSPVRGILNLIKSHSCSQPRPFLSHTHMDFPLLVHFSGRGFVWLILLGNLWEPFQLPVWVFFFRPHGMWDISSPTRAWIHAPCTASTVLTTGPPRKSCGILFFFFFLVWVLWSWSWHSTFSEFSFFHFYTIFKVTFHVQLLQNIGSIPHVVQHTLELV